MGTHSNACECLRPKCGVSSQPYRARQAHSAALISQLHELEADWDSVTEQSHIHGLLEERAKLLRYRRELVVSLANPARLNDRKRRPGRLLDEERKFAALSRLPDLDSRLRSIAETWQREKERVLVYQGQAVLAILRDEQGGRDNDRDRDSDAPPSGGGGRLYSLSASTKGGERLDQHSCDLGCDSCAEVALALPPGPQEGGVQHHERGCWVLADVSYGTDAAGVALVALDALDAAEGSCAQQEPRACCQCHGPSTCGPRPRPPSPPHYAHSHPHPADASTVRPSGTETAAAALRLVLSTELQVMAASAAHQYLLEVPQPLLASRWRQLAAVLRRLRQLDERVMERALHAARTSVVEPVAPEEEEEEEELLTTAVGLAHALWPTTVPTLGAPGAELFGRKLLALGQRMML